MIWYILNSENNDNAVKAFSTTKSDLPIHVQMSFNENEEQGLKAILWQNIYSTLASKLKIKPHQLVFAKQTHSANIKIVDEKQNGIPLSDTDGLITNLKGVCLCIQTADCTPVLLFDPVNEIVAAVHAGWRGTAQNITGKAVSLMKYRFGTDPGNVKALIGPCVSQENYEVGSDVYEAFEAIGLNIESIFKSAKTAGKYFCNLKRANTELLIRQGVLFDNIKTDNQCTYQQNELYYSARRDGGKTGRIISGIMIK